MHQISVLRHLLSYSAPVLGTITVCNDDIHRQWFTGNANDTAGGTGLGVARLQRLLVTLAEVVGAGVDDDGALAAG